MIEIVPFKRTNPLGELVVLNDVLSRFVRVTVQLADVADVADVVEGESDLLVHSLRTSRLARITHSQN